MIKPGLTSVTFRQLTYQEIISLAVEASLIGIEWGGDIHVPPDDIPKARQVCRETTDAGLITAAYGSYYKVGESEVAGLEFEKVLDTAVALNAPIIRVWAGSRGSVDADKKYWKHVVSETRRIADMAASAGINISYEFHSGTLTDTSESTRKLLQDIAHDNVMTYWQPIHSIGVKKNCEGLDTVLPWVSNIHVFHWPSNSKTRQLLSVGNNDWEKYLQKLAVAETTLDHFILIEFVKDNTPENFIKDAKTLLNLLPNSLSE